MQLSHRRGASCCRRDHHPQRGDHPEDPHESPRHQISRAFVPPCIRGLKVVRRVDCLSRTSHPLARTGTLDAHSLTSDLQVACRHQRVVVGSPLCRKNRHLRRVCPGKPARLLRTTGACAHRLGADFRRPRGGKAFVTIRRRCAGRKCPRYVPGFRTSGAGIRSCASFPGRAAVAAVRRRSNRSVRAGAP